MQDDWTGFLDAGRVVYQWQSVALSWSLHVVSYHLVESRQSIAGWYANDLICERCMPFMLGRTGKRMDCSQTNCYHVEQMCTSNQYVSILYVWNVS
jgi:hypothetical protein